MGLNHYCPVRIIGVQYPHRHVAHIGTNYIWLGGTVNSTSTPLSKVKVLTSTSCNQVNVKVLLNSKGKNIAQINIY